jgi:CheY-like chemotaxis protein
MSRCILACDHEPHVTRIMSLKLERAGYDVRTTASGVTALQRLHDLSPELLIVDADLAGIDGLEVITRLRNEPEFFDLPVILLTTHPVDAEQIVELRVDHVLQKPFSPRELTSVARTLLPPQTVLV